MQTMDGLTIAKELAAIERRTVQVNGALMRLRLALERGDIEAAANLRALAQELNWTNRRALLDAGAPDSILRTAGQTTYTPDGEAEAGTLDLAELSTLPMDAPENR